MTMPEPQDGPEVGSIHNLELHITPEAVLQHAREIIDAELLPGPDGKEVPLAMKQFLAEAKAVSRELLESQKSLSKIRETLKGSERLDIQSAARTPRQLPSDN